MRKILLIILIIFVVSIGLAYAFTSENKQNNVNLPDKKILIVYFSRTGNTKAIAKMIQEKTGGEIFEIETKETYPGGYEEMTEIAKYQKENNILPELKENKDVSNYDVIFVGTPVWWYEISAPVKAYLSKNNFEGKIIAPFITHGGGGKYSIPQDIKEITKGAKVLEPMVVLNGGNLNTKKEVFDWIEKLKI